MKKVILLVLGLFVCGCATRAEVINVRETLWTGTSQMRTEYLETIKQIATSQPTRQYNANDVRLREQALTELGDFVSKSRQDDTSIFSRPTTGPSQ